MNEDVNDYEVEGKKLWELLYTLAHAEDQENVKQEKLVELLNAVKGKVDGYHYVAQQYKAEQNRLDDIIKAFQKKKKTIENQEKSFKNYLKNVMEYDGVTMLKGNLAKVSLRKTKQSVVPSFDADAKAAIKYPDYIEVKRVYQWRKELMRQRFAEDEKVKELCHLQDNQSITIGLLSKK